MKKFKTKFLLTTKALGKSGQLRLICVFVFYLKTTSYKIATSQWKKKEINFLVFEKTYNSKNVKKIIFPSNFSVRSDFAKTVRNIYMFSCVYYSSHIISFCYSFHGCEFR